MASLSRKREVDEALEVIKKLGTETVSGIRSTTRVNFKSSGKRLDVQLLMQPKTKYRRTDPCGLPETNQETGKVNYRCVNYAEKIYEEAMAEYKRAKKKGKRYREPKKKDYEYLGCMYYFTMEGLDELYAMVKSTEEPKGHINMDLLDAILDTNRRVDESMMNWQESTDHYMQSIYLEPLVSIARERQPEVLEALLFDKAVRPELMSVVDKVKRLIREQDEPDMNTVEQFTRLVNGRRIWLRCSKKPDNDMARYKSSVLESAYVKNPVRLTDMEGKDNIGDSYDYIYTLGRDNNYDRNQLLDLFRKARYDDERLTELVPLSPSVGYNAYLAASGRPAGKTYKVGKALITPLHGDIVLQGGVMNGTGAVLMCKHGKACVIAKNPNFIRIYGVHQKMEETVLDAIEMLGEGRRNVGAMIDGPGYSLNGYSPLQHDSRIEIVNATVLPDTARYPATIDPMTRISYLDGTICYPNYKRDKPSKLRVEELHTFDNFETSFAKAVKDLLQTHSVDTLLRGGDILHQMSLMMNCVCPGDDGLRASIKNSRRMKPGELLLITICEASGNFEDTDVYSLTKNDENYVIGRDSNYMVESTKTTLTMTNYKMQLFPKRSDGLNLSIRLSELTSRRSAMIREQQLKQLSNAARDLNARELLEEGEIDEINEWDEDEAALEIQDIEVPDVEDDYEHQIE